MSMHPVPLRNRSVRQFFLKEIDNFYYLGIHTIIKQYGSRNKAQNKY